MSDTQHVSPAQTGSLNERAADEASRVAETAKVAVGEVASTATDQATMVIDDARAQVRSIVEQVREEVQSQAGTRVSDAAIKLRSVATEMDALAQGSPENAQQLTTYLSQAHDKVDGFASRLEEGGANGLFDDISSFARRRPGVFLLCCMGAGFALGRMMRSGALSSQQPSSLAAAQLAPPSGQGYEDGAIPIGADVKASSYGDSTSQPTAPDETLGWERNPS